MRAVSKRWILAGVLAISAIGTGVVAHASIPGTDGVVSACFSNSASHGLHPIGVIDSTGTCPSGTTALSWNQQGPAGPQGATGPQGPAGPQGQQGVAGVVGSLEQLNGIPCTRNNTAGTVQESLDTSAYARLRCIIPVTIAVTGRAACGPQLCTGATVSVTNFAGTVSLVSANNDGVVYNQPVTTDASGSGSVGFVIGNGTCAVYGVPPGHVLLYPIRAVDSSNYGTANASVPIDC